MLRTFTILFLASLLTSLAQQAKPWPKLLKGRGVAKVILPQNEHPPFIYLSKNFKFVSNNKLDSSKISAFAATAESVPSAVGKIPLKLKRLPVLAEGKVRHPIYITSTIAEFVQMGGSEHSAGYYSGRKKAVILRADKFLDVKRPDYRLLTHELVHLCMHGINGKANAWFTEGNAEYFACAFYGTSSYKFASISQSIKDRTKRFFKRGEQLELHGLKEFVTRDVREWRVINKDLEPENRYSQYMTSLLLVHYFYHIDPTGRKKIAQYLALMEDGRKDIADQAHLFPKGEFVKIQNTIVKYWKPRGYRILFSEPTQ